MLGFVYRVPLGPYKGIYTALVFWGFSWLRDLGSLVGFLLSHTRMRTIVGAAAFAIRGWGLSCQTCGARLGTVFFHLFLIIVPCVHAILLVRRSLSILALGFRCRCPWLHRLGLWSIAEVGVPIYVEDATEGDDRLFHEWKLNKEVQPGILEGLSPATATYTTPNEILKLSLLLCSCAWHSQELRSRRLMRSALLAEGACSVLAARLPAWRCFLVFCWTPNRVGPKQNLNAM